MRSSLFGEHVKRHNVVGYMNNIKVAISKAPRNIVCSACGAIVRRWDKILVEKDHSLCNKCGAQWLRETADALAKIAGNLDGEKCCKTPCETKRKRRGRRSRRSR